MNWKIFLAVGAMTLFACACNAQDTGDEGPQAAATEATEEAATEATEEAATEATEEAATEA